MEQIGSEINKELGFLDVVLAYWVDNGKVSASVGDVGVAAVLWFAIASATL